jgi:ornithine cyclodeaminase
MKVTILKENEIRGCVTLDQEAVIAVAEGFVCLTEGKASLPPIIRVDVSENRGEVDIKTAFLHGRDFFAIKIASGFFDNPSIGLPYGSGMMVVINAKTGFLEALLLDNGYLTDLRTGLAGAIAAKYLAPSRVRTAGVIGSGVQARYQIHGLKLVRDIERLLVFGILPDQVDQYVDEMRQALGIKVEKCASPEEVVVESDIVVTTTPSRQPYLKAEWLHSGQHITCMGADGEHKQELHADVFRRADRLACDSRAQCLRLGELHHALKSGVIKENDEISELGELISGRKPGRQTDTEITICDLTGVGVQDTAIALLTYERARAKGLGVLFEA